MSDVQLKYLEWDSVFFNKKIFKLDTRKDQSIDEVLSIIDRTDADLFYVFSEQEIYWPDKNDVKLVDSKVNFRKRIEKHNAFSDQAINSVTKCNDALLKLSVLSGSHSRFKIDIKLKDKFEELYEIWIKKSISREISTEVLAYYENNIEIGFVTIKKNVEQAVIGLIAVSPEHQGKKIGSKLLNAIEFWCQTHKVTYLNVATQLNNIQACEFYLRNGYSINEINHIYHYYKS